MKSRLIATAAVLSGAIAASSLALAASTHAVPWPEGYRHWFHVHIMVIEPGHPLYAAFGGMHDIYANDKALSGYRSGKFPDGSMLVLDLYATVSADHTLTAGAHKLVGVMYKDNREFAATGGWGFEAFAEGKPDKRMVGNQAASACFSCHMAQKDHDYVFSRLRN